MYETDNYSKLENILHNHFKSYNIQLEWFNDIIDIKKVIALCPTYDKLINNLKKNNNPFI